MPQSSSKSKSADSVRKECAALIDQTGKYAPNTEAFRQGAVAALKWTAGLTAKRPSSIVTASGAMEELVREKEWK